MKTLVSALERAGERVPEGVGYTFVTRAGDERVGYRAMAERARAVGAALAERARPGDRILLLYPPGLDFLAGFFGCAYGGCVAVPAYPPDPTRLARTLPRLQVIAEDAGADIVMTTPAIRDLFTFVLEQTPALAKMTWMVEPRGPGAGDSWRPPAITPSSTAFLQYTSGSTREPRGVVVSHANLLENMDLMRRAFDCARPDSHAVNWLPLYHDMGLIGASLVSVLAGHPATLLSPLDFLADPVVWLDAITRFGGTHCGGPNFGYRLCAQRVTDEALARLDLSTWRLAFNGAEPIEPDTLRRFAERFAPCGFKPEAFYPCYGLAEATLFVSGGPIDAPPRLLHLDPDALERGHVLPAAPEAGRAVAASGDLHPEARVRIIDPEGGAPCPQDRVGEIQVAGPCVAEGYWRRPDDTLQTFGLDPDEGGPWLRTGDLGFVRHGQLFVLGRLKDLIIVRGRNHYPQDIEATAEGAHPMLRTGCAAAFSIDVDGQEHAAIAIEARAGALPHLEEIAAALRAAVAHEHDLRLHAVALVEPRAIPKTSSGKIQRRAARQSFLDGTLEVIATHTLTHAPAPPHLDRRLLDAIAPDLRLASLLDALRRRVAALTDAHPDALDPDLPLNRLGLDSLAATELQHHLAVDLRADLGLSDLLGGATLRQLAAAVLDADPADPRLAMIPAADPLSPAPLTLQQARSWSFDRLLEGGSFRFHVSGAWLLTGDIDPDDMRRALHALADRHPVLRARLSDDRDGHPIQRTDPHNQPAFTAHDLKNINKNKQMDALDAIAAAQTADAFDLEAGGLCRVAMVALAPREAALLVTLHHIIADAASVAVFVEELAALYDARRRQIEPALPPPAASFLDFARWQRAALPDEDLQALRALWRATFDGAPTELQLDLDLSDVQAIQTADSGHRLLTLTPEAADALRALSAACGATLSMTLFAAWQALLGQLAGAEDLIVDSVFSNRTRPELARTIGFIAENVVVRADLSGDPSFEALVERVRRGVLEAYDRRSWRSVFFGDEALGAVALSPICFNMQPPTFDGHIDLPSIALTPMPDLTRRLMTHCLGAILYVFEQGGGLHFDLIHNRALFDDAWACDLLDRLDALLARIVDDPARPLSALLGA